MLCAAVVPPTMPEADFGIFYMDDVQYLDMCGHASIGVGTALQEIGLVPKAHRDRYAIETPAGLVWIKNNFKEDYVYSTTVRNVNSYVIENELRIDVDDVKDVWPTAATCLLSYRRPGSASRYSPPIWSASSIIPPVSGRSLQRKALP